MNFARFQKVMMSVEFYFVGRLTEEKWFSWILHAATKLSEQWITNFAIHVIGSGVLVDDLLEHPLYEKHLFYHGRLPKEQTIGLRRNAHYTLMPSQFLETFGLVALDSIALWAPVIGRKKWWLSPFIIDTYAVNSLETLASCMSSCIRTFSIEQRKKESILALKTTSEYTSHKRIDRVWQLSNTVKKSYLLVSDYAVDIGGIENFVLQTQGILEVWNATTLFIGKKKRVIGKRRIVDLFVALCNVQFSYELFITLKNTSYDVVWLHSVQRRIGRLPLLVLSCLHKKEIWVMYHDFWLLHPFPSAVNEESQLVRAASFCGYVAEWKMIFWKKWYRGGYILIVGKYLYSRMLLWLLRRIASIHLVPSEYLVEHFARRGITTQVLPHFVSHAQPWSDT